MKTIEHRFVEYIPSSDQLEKGVLYISMEYGTAVHKCMCGCGQKVVTPFSPTDWKLTYDGESVSLYPSIGNWNFECQSHYWVKNGRIVIAESWSDFQIEKNRKKDLTIKRKQFDTESKSKIKNDSGALKQTNGFLSKVIRAINEWFSSRLNR